MSQIDKPISPLRQRMIDAMTLRKLGDKTQAGYIRAVRFLAAYLRRSPDTASSEDLRAYQLHMVHRGVSAVSINAAITGLKFFFEVTLQRPDAMARMSPVHVPHKLPVVLTAEEVARLIACAGNLQYKAALSVAYGAGLRASGVVSLKVGDTRIIRSLRPSSGSDLDQPIAWHVDSVAGSGNRGFQLTAIRLLFDINVALIIRY